MKPVDVTIIGAGLSGLCCARRLLQCGISFQILEAANAVGGRVRTDQLEGFRLDRGFQIYLPSYPEGRRVLDYDRLQLKHFTRGAKIWFGGRFHRVADPRVEFFTAIKSSWNPIGTLADKLKLARFAQRLNSSDIDRQDAFPEQTMLSLLHDLGGFSNTIIDRLFKPFLGGVFLEPDLATSSRFGRFVFRMFASGPGAVPEVGMQQIPEQIAAGLPCEAIRLNSAVAKWQPGEVTLQSGEVLQTRAVVLATESDEALRLSAGTLQTNTTWNSTANLYYASPKFESEPILHLDGEGRGPLNLAVVMSAASAAYAPPDQSLISCSTIGLPNLSDAELDAAARPQLRSWFGDTAKQWRLLKVYRIAKALPKMSVGTLTPWQRGVYVSPGLYVCGDHRDQSSINGAMLSGFRSAQAVAQDLSEGRV